MLKKLELKFLNEHGKIVTYALETPIEPVAPTAVKSEMKEILVQNSFTGSGGDLVSIKGARFVEHNVEEIESV
ncbi:DUF2922 domain-containing protein [Virgibacillus dakarensis]|uniref:DUF2922 domain-containing protein n=1 Tax=Virgibacillus dakarensis TaxID=1917889 RepID=UPI00389B2594